MTEPILPGAAALIEEFESHHPESIRLAETLSLAVRVEPELLRRARLTLHPGVGAGAEADLWFSSLVESSSARGFVFSPDVQQELRKRLAAEPTRLRAAWELIQSFHRFIPTVVALEEQVTWLTLAKGADAAPEVEQLLGKAVRAMVSSPERGLGIARWAAGALLRLPDSARQSEAAMVLAIGTAARVGGQLLQKAGVLPKRIPLSARRVIPESLERVTLRLRWEPGSLVFVGPDAEGPLHEFQAPATLPVFLTMEWTVGQEVQQRLLVAEPGSREVLPENVSTLRLIALDGQAWELSSRPATATKQRPSLPEEADRKQKPGERHVPSQGQQGRPPDEDQVAKLEAMRATVATLRSRGVLHEARTLQELIVDTSRKTLGEEHAETLRAISDLAEMLLADGEYSMARRLLERAFESLRLTRGLEHSDTLTAMGNLALILRGQGDLQGARELQQQVLNAAHWGVWEPEHPNMLLAMSNLAETLRAQGDLTGARKLLEQVLETARVGVWGPEHPNTLTAMSNLAETLRAQGELSGARKLLEQVLDTARGGVWGPAHPNTLTTMSNLAAVCGAQGDLTGARKLLEQVLETARSGVWGPEHPNTLTTMSNLAAILRAQGDLAGASKLQQQVLDAARSGELGPEHPNTLTAMINLAVTLRAQGDLSGARKLLEQVLETARSGVWGPEDPNTHTAMVNLAATLHDQGNISGARKLLEQVLADMTRLLGIEHPETLVVLNNFALTLREQGDLESALSLWRRVLEIRVRILGEAHPDTLVTLENLARALEQQGEVTEARAVYERLLRQQGQQLGEDHSRTLDTKRRLAALRMEHGDGETEAPKPPIASSSSSTEERNQHPEQDQHRERRTEPEPMGEWLKRAKNLAAVGRTRDAARLYESHDFFAEAARLFEEGNDPRGALRCAILANDKDTARRLIADVPTEQLPKVLERFGAYELLMEHYISEGDFENVARLYERARQFDQAALAYERAGKLVLARKAYERSGDFAAANRVRDLEVKALVERGDRLGAATLLVNARRHQEALEVLAALPPPKAFHFLTRLRLTDEARALAQKELALAEAENKPARRARWLELLGEFATAAPLYEEIGRKEKAMELYEKLGHLTKAAALAEELQLRDKATSLYTQLSDSAGLQRAQSLPATPPPKQRTSDLTAEEEAEPSSSEDTKQS